ncbi:MAG: SoxR reducing system RseC family protein [Gammaproteobacteria bacterium]|nr:SoxR reducing system RseC family protein [Gammaproteobacteria bacterium]
MIEEQACVICVEAGGYAWVETQRQGTCTSCAVNKGCGTAVLAKWFENRRNRVRVLDPIDTQVGDRVVVGVHEDALVKGSLVVYMLPLICLMGMAIFGNHLLAATEYGELASVVFGLLGLAIGWAGVNRFSRKISSDSHYQPVILRRDP